MENFTSGIKGLTDKEVRASRLKYGINELNYKKENGFTAALISSVKEPMFILLLAAATIYFLTGKLDEGIFMASAILLVTAISLYQDSKSRNAIAALKNLTQPKSKVIRNKEVTEILSSEIVVRDCMIIEEGTLITADAEIIQSNDFAVNESILTGESFSINKNNEEGNNLVFQGTMLPEVLQSAE